MSEDLATRRRRRSLYTLLIVIATVLAAGQIATVSSREGDTAFLSANDRSRWCTIAALVEDGTYAIDRLIEIRDERGRRPWYTIDLVRHRGPDGELHYYSSKPPLLPTMVAGVYAIVHGVTGMTLTAQPIYATRVVLALVNLPLLWLFLYATARVVELVGGERPGAGDWTRRYLVAVACFGTLLLPFAWSLSNHLPAATSSAVAMWIFLAADARRRGGPAPRRVPGWWWIAMGVAAAFAAANELPALSMLVFWGGLVVLVDWRGALPFAFGAGLVAAGFFGTNWLAHESLRPPYAHRGVGPTVTTVQVDDGVVPSDDAREVNDRFAASVHEALRGAGAIDAGEPITVTTSSVPGRWMARTRDDRLFAVLVEPVPVEPVPVEPVPDEPVPVEPAESAGERPDTLPDRASDKSTGDADRDRADRADRDRGADGRVTVTLAEWDDWYEYPRSYWRGGVRHGVDRGEPSRAIYLFQMTFGHHGLFSLTPLWLLVPWGWWLGFRRYPRGLRGVTAATALATCVCGVFYLARPEIDRNYGGVSICFRWLIWMVPFWIFAVAPAVQRLATSRAGRVVAVGLFAWGLFSVAASLDSPWQHPWIYRFWTFLGWITE